MNVFYRRSSIAPRWLQSDVCPSFCCDADHDAKRLGPRHSSGSAWSSLHAVAPCRRGSETLSTAAAPPLLQLARACNERGAGVIDDALFPPYVERWSRTLAHTARSFHDSTAYSLARVARESVLFTSCSQEQVRGRETVNAKGSSGPAPCIA